ncbi:hypothetical protein [Legionella rowbothamii]|uniref:hypothetical protein n=1 Tax=Legionella rowbothamii TaxID=96229 RepID=UPI001056C675|nr:hypothetical protein [Legionella rowbothamii]
MPLFILDFDETIASENTHNAVSHLTKMDEMWDVIKEIPPIEGPNTWRDIIRSILSEGHSLAIASFNAYGSTFIPRYLQEVIGLSADEVQAIHIESWLPAHPRQANKNEHIMYSIKDMKYTGSPDSIVLVDDDLKNITAAGKNGYKTIHATGKYIEHIQHLSSDWNYSAQPNSFMYNFFKIFGATHKPTLTPDEPIPNSDKDSDKDSSSDSNCIVM